MNSDYSRVVRPWPTSAIIAQLDGSGLFYYIYGDTFDTSYSDKIYATLRIDCALMAPVGGIIEPYFEISLDGEKFIPRTASGEPFTPLKKGSTLFPYLESKVLTDLGIVARLVFKFPNSVPGDYGVTPDCRAIIRGPAVST